MSFPLPSEHVSGTPVNAGSFVVFDTETTGLNIATDRVIEIGAVRVSRGSICENDTFSCLVDPRMPIPVKSTTIHGITDADVEGADDVTAVFANFAAWAGPTVFLAYSIGFDLAVLKSEHQRHNRPWQAPRCLDVRHLVQIIAPELPNYGLEVVGAWLGLDEQVRHRALGDAQATAEIFVAILPMLQKRGISTLAQAERACRKRASQHTQEIAQGWHDVLQHAPTGVAAYARIDSYPYRHQIKDVMHAPPVFLDGNRSLSAAIKQMMACEISSVFVTADDTGQPGILTERDILRTIDSNEPEILEHPIDGFANRPLISVPGSEFLYRAVSIMASKGFRHLGVHDESGQIVGALSARDLLKQRADGIISLGDSIDDAANASELAHIWSQLITVVSGLVHEEVDPRDIAAVISRELRALTRRASQIAEHTMLVEGLGEPPVPFAMLVLGSGGRGESLLAMDQDNAIVYASGQPDGPEDQWFAELGRRTADILDTAGVSYCNGGIMASNAAWRKSADDWRDTVSQWLSRANPEDILNSDIFFDAVDVFGDPSLADTLREESYTLAKRSTAFVKCLSMRAAEFRVPLGLFGRFKLDGGRMDIKIGGIMPIFSSARVLALQNGIMARSTPERLEELTRRLPEHQSTIDRLLQAHKTLLGAILNQQLLDVEAGIPLSNSISPDILSAHQRDEIRWALKQVSLVSGLLDVPVV